LLLHSILTHDLHAYIIRARLLGGSRHMSRQDTASSQSGCSWPAPRSYSISYVPSPCASRTFPAYEGKIFFDWDHRAAAVYRQLRNSGKSCARGCTVLVDASCWRERVSQSHPIPMYVHAPRRGVRIQWGKGARAACMFMSLASCSSGACERMMISEVPFCMLCLSMSANTCRGRGTA